MYSVRTNSSSYRTYEEWKPICSFTVASVGASSYRTYEEWKLTENDVIVRNLNDVLTVPMRNGNTFVYIVFR